MKYILFKKVVEEKTAPVDSMYAMFGISYVIPGEEWKSENAKGQKKTERIVFVAMVESPKDVITLVRKSPTEKYLLFCGEVEELSVAMPVFMGGKNLAQLDSEWRDEA